MISIHALREEGDHPLPVCRNWKSNFYPRPPRGGRRQSSFLGCSRFLFLSTPSARRATGSGIAGSTDRRISIHALREEGDHPYSSWERGSNEFLSTPSARRATIPRPHLLCWHHDFYPRPPRGGRRRAAGVVPPVGLISIHALREEGDVLRRVWRVRLADFYPRPPRGGRRL